MKHDKTRVVKTHRCSSMDGMKDVDVGGRASLENRRRGNFHVTGKGSEPRSAKGYSDMEQYEMDFGILPL